MHRDRILEARRIWRLCATSLLKGRSHIGYSARYSAALVNTQEALFQRSATTRSVCVNGHSAGELIY